MLAARAKPMSGRQHSRGVEDPAGNEKNRRRQDAYSEKKTPERSRKLFEAEEKRRWERAARGVRERAARRTRQQLAGHKRQRNTLRKNGRSLPEARAP